MLHFFGSLPINVIRAFRKKNLLWHLAAVALTYVIVASGFDWFYFLHTRSDLIRTLSFPAVFLGGILPIILPLILLVIGEVVRDKKVTALAWMLGQAAVIGYFVSIAYKSFTGRIPPQRVVGLDISREFHFGWMKEGVFWGWPSLHTTVAFAMAVAFVTFFPKSAKVKWLALGYAFLIGLGVSTTIHWFSEFAAGALIGSVIGLVVGKSFKSIDG